MTLLAWTHLPKLYIRCPPPQDSKLSAPRELTLFSRDSHFTLKTRTLPSSLISSLAFKSRIFTSSHRILPQASLSPLSSLASLSPQASLSRLEPQSLASSLTLSLQVSLFPFKPRSRPSRFSPSTRHPAVHIKSCSLHATAPHSYPCSFSPSSSATSRCPSHPFPLSSSAIGSPMRPTHPTTTTSSSSTFPLPSVCLESAQSLIKRSI